LYVYKSEMVATEEIPELLHASRELSTLRAFGLGESYSLLDASMHGSQPPHQPAVCGRIKASLPKDLQIQTIHC
jgi:hypothetical protein